MWKLNEAGTRAENKRAGCNAFVTAAVIVNDEDETRIESMHDTLDEAKAALAKFVADENAEEAKDFWQIDDDGNAHSPTGKIFRSRLNGYRLPFLFAVFKHTNVAGIESMETLTFTKTDDEARDFIAKTVAKLNDELYYTVEED